MALARAQSGAYLGIQAYPVTVETDVGYGLPQFNVVGLPDASVKESRERVRSAIKNSGLPFTGDKITINLAPADVKKEGPAFDLPIAISLLAASGVIPEEALQGFLFVGELALDGTLRPFKGALVLAQGLKDRGALIFPEENAREAALEASVRVYGCRTLTDVVQFLLKEKQLSLEPPATLAAADKTPQGFDFSEVKGQPLAKRALEIAVAGGHNLLFIGPPGSGKTMLAARVPSIMPPLSTEESIEVMKVYSVAGLVEKPLLSVTPPFRSPHYSTSPPALIGGGSWPKPGEISLAHRGVLFLDEMPEFRKDVLESLRSPLEDGWIWISRAKLQTGFPCRFMLLAAMNPCPCGFLTDPQKNCRCSSIQIQKYQTKISGPILDRIDLHVDVPAVSYQTLTQEAAEESSADIRERILRCRQIQKDRFSETPLKLNAWMRSRDIKRFAQPSAEGQKLLETAMKRLHFSARAYYKILKLGRTIADLAGAETVAASHLAEAIQYRTLDRERWG
ncbi:MAG: YifB family Mg chelatase-like AAA ATPase [Candidatus Omnitrophica bacterium]|nr:YifB family Mg chelatase-like AAA ATPase [Candidatus Omnitrophota bacterium]